MATDEQFLKKTNERTPLITTRQSVQTEDEGGKYGSSAIPKIDINAQQMRLEDHGLTPQELAVKNTPRAPDREQLSKCRAIGNTVNAFVGFGLLSKAYALEKSGIFVGVSIIILCGLLAAWLAKLFKTGAELPHFTDYDNEFTYEELGQYAFYVFSGGKAGWGRVGRYMVKFAVIFEYLGVLLASLIYLLQTQQALVQTWVPSYETDALGVFLLSLALLPAVQTLTWKNLANWSWLGTSASCAIVVLSLVVLLLHLFAPPFAAAATEAADFQDLGIQWSTDLEGTAIAMGVIIMAYGGLVYLPGIMRELKRPDDYATIANVSFLLMAVLYACVGVFGYLTFGANIRDNYAMSIHMWSSEAGAGWTVPRSINLGINLLLFVSLYTQVPIIVKILAETPEDLLICEDDADTRPGIYRDGAGRSLAPFIWNDWVRKCIRCTMMVVCMIVASQFFEKLACVMAVTGNIFVMLTSFLMPLLFPTMIYWGAGEHLHRGGGQTALTGLQRISRVVALLMLTGLMFVSTYFTIMSESCQLGAAQGGVVDPTAR